MDAAVAHDLVVRIAVGYLRRSPPVAHERHVGQGQEQVRHETGGREGHAAALAAAVDGDARRVDERVGSGRLDGADRVGQEAPVVVGRRIGDAERGVAREAAAGCAGLRIRGVAGAPRAALAANVHDEMGVARARGHQPVDRPAAAAAVADVLDHARQAAVADERRGGNVPRRQEPALDRLPTEAGKGEVPAVDRRQPRFDRFEGSRQRVRAGVGQRVGPEGVEVGRLLAIGLVDP